MAELGRIGIRLRELREEIGWSQREVAEACGLNRKNIVRFEGNESNPTAETLMILADFYEVSVDYILCRTDSRGTFWDKPKIIEKLVRVEVQRKFFNPKWEEEAEE